MTTKQELLKWVNTLADDARIAIDDGGLTLEADDLDGHQAYFEVGGWPDDACIDDEESRDRATDPRLGDQTACKHCELDIEYSGNTHGWRDRGNNNKCNGTRRKHAPVSDRE